MKIICSETDYEALLDTMAWSMQLPFFECRTEDCPIYMKDDECCYEHIKECVERNWEVEIVED